MAPVSGFVTQILPAIQRLAYDCPIYVFDIQQDRLISRTELIDAISTAFHNLVETSPYSEELAAEQRLTSLLSHVTVLGRYAILSHRWESDELSFADAQDVTLMSSRNGYAKFRGFCEVAATYGCRYVWLDTLCIDKRSTSELDESIRSMYKWYRSAYVCIAYLKALDDASLEQDPWFSRGWTLQELLAPQRVKFYRGDWSEANEGCTFDIVRKLSDRPWGGVYYGDDRFSVEHLPDDPPMPVSGSSPFIARIAAAAGVSTKSLLDHQPHPTSARSVFAYVGSRTTSRPEDIAYCLFGLLDVSMPIAYGEGLSRAFHRLQVECIRHAADDRIFAWSGQGSKWCSMLASDPTAFLSLPSSAPQDQINVDEEVIIENSPSTPFSFVNSELNMFVYSFDIERGENGIPKVTLGSSSSDGTACYTITLTLLEPYDTEVTVRWNGPPPTPEKICEFLKVAVIGKFANQGGNPFVLLLSRREGGRSYTRLGSAKFARIPSYDELVNGTHYRMVWQTIYIA